MLPVINLARSAQLCCKCYRKTKKTIKKQNNQLPNTHPHPLKKDKKNKQTNKKTKKNKTKQNKTLITIV